MIKEKTEKRGLEDYAGLFSVTEIIKRIEAVEEGQVLVLDLIYDPDTTQDKDGDLNARTI